MVIFLRCARGSIIEKTHCDLSAFQGIVIASSAGTLLGLSSHHRVSTRDAPSIFLIAIDIAFRVQVRPCDSDATRTARSLHKPCLSVISIIWSAHATALSRTDRDSTRGLDNGAVGGGCIPQP
jgi:hypothetical protein